MNTEGQKVTQDELFSFRGFDAEIIIRAQPWRGVTHT